MEKKLILSSGQTKMISCCVMGNEKRPVFYGSITLSNCSVNEDQLIDSSPTIESNGTEFFSSFSLFGLEKCYEFIQTPKFYNEILSRLLLKKIYYFSLFLS